MKRSFFSLLLVAAMLFAFASRAEEFSYVPGETTRRLLDGALTDGRMLAGVTRFSLITDAEGADGSLAKGLAALGRVLTGCQFYAAAGTSGDGLRTEFAVRYEHGTKSAGADASLTVGPDGFFLESSLFEGYRLETLWKDVLDPEGAASVSALFRPEPDGNPEGNPDGNPNGNPNDAADAGALQPYADFVLEWASALPAETETDAPAEGAFPAAAQKTAVVVSEEEAADFLEGLAGLLEADERLPALWAESGFSSLAGDFPAEVSESLRSLASLYRADEDPSVLRFTSARDAAGRLLYWIAEEYGNAADDYLGIALILGDSDGERSLRCFAGSESDGVAKSLFDAEFRFRVDPENPLLLAFSFDGDLQQEGISFEADYDRHLLMEDGEPCGYESDCTGEIAVVADGREHGVGARANLQRYETIMDGEALDASGRVILAEGADVACSVEYEGGYSIEPDTERGFVAEYDLTLVLDGESTWRFMAEGQAFPVPFDREAVSRLTPVSFADDDALERLGELAGEGIERFASEFVAAVPTGDLVEIVDLLDKLQEELE